jgi:phage terminase large subunit
MEFNEKLILSNLAECRYTVHQGGTGSGKTFSTLQYLILYAYYNRGCVISVVSETLPHLKRGTIRDFKRILNMEGWSHLFKENKTEHTFTIGKSVIEFFSADNEAKLRGARRDILFINECNNVDYDSFMQMDVRTRIKTILDFNPVRRFWVHDKLMPTIPAEDYLFVKSSYLTNKHLLDEEKRNIERHRNNAGWWKVYGEGEIGVPEGVVFSNWEIKVEAKIESEPESQSQPGNLLGYGIDFGFTHSPTAIVQVNEFNGELYVHELLYRNGMQNSELFAFAQKHIDLKALTVADSAEPKTVDYLYRKGWVGLKAADKSADSVLFGINLLLDRKLNITAESLNLIKELRQYMWDTNKDGAIIHRPVKENDHAIDALRYLYAYPKKRGLVFA